VDINICIIIVFSPSYITHTKACLRYT